MRLFVAELLFAMKKDVIALWFRVSASLARVLEGFGEGLFHDNHALSATIFYELRLLRKACSEWEER